MTKYFFDVPPAAGVPVRGSDSLYPIRRIFCVGRNYEAHAREMGAVPDRGAPFFFTKTPFHWVLSGATLAYPPATSNYHYEMELVVAIGTPTFQVSAEYAWVSIFGYGCGLDMTRRDLQYKARDKGHPWDLGKDFEDSAVLSPLVRAADVGRMTHGRIELKVNGAVKQASDLSLLIHPVPAIIADLSKFYHLLPGDLIYTGTPEGVGPVGAGDRLDGSIDGLGTISAQIGTPSAELL
jgi:fumarylpyruvate hydrolase